MLPAFLPVPGVGGEPGAFPSFPRRRESTSRVGDTQAKNIVAACMDSRLRGSDVYAGSVGPIRVRRSCENTRHFRYARSLREA